MMKSYADTVGADYRFDHNQNYMGRLSKYFDIMRPVYDEWFDEYETVLYLDIDIYPVAGLKESIFDIEIADMAMCQEPDQPEMREKSTFFINGRMDKVWRQFVKDKWGANPPLDSKGRVLVFNTGVVLFSREGRQRIRSHPLTPQEYVSGMLGSGIKTWFYTSNDQPYLHALAHTPEITFTELSPEWNRQVVNKYDKRTPETKFVHVQLRGADNWDDHKILKVLNAEVKAG